MFIIKESGRGDGGGMLLLNCEELFRFGLIFMGATVILMIICIVLFFVSGRRIKKVLEEEYGEPYC